MPIASESSPVNFCISTIRFYRYSIKTTPSEPTQAYAGLNCYDCFFSYPGPVAAKPFKPENEPLL